ncbi:MAG: glycine--tRNA ligase subunit beta, partial [Asticcacaulis sp.]
GHRFMGAAEPFTVGDFADYQAKLRAHFVLLEAAERRALILKQAGAVCQAAGLELVPDEGLLDEVCGLAEWPVPVLGDMDPAFLSLPPEVIRTSMRTHQKYFAVRDPKTGLLAPHFVTVANIVAADGGAEIKRGNAKVLSARLNDARFFWDEDRKAGNFDRWLGKLTGVTFHARLGSMKARVERIVTLATWLAPKLGVDADLAARAARLAKADLASGMVGEFPELQGIMGGYYAREAGLEAALADAVRDHYRPQGPSDTVPTAPLSVLVALADKLDMLVSFFAIDEKPTGSKDPFALRRAALGIIRLILESGTRLALSPVLAEVATTAIRAASDVATEGARDNLGENLKAVPPERLPQALSVAAEIVNQPADGGDISEQVSALVRDLLAFFADRLKVQLREEGRRHDLVDAVFSLGDDDLVRIVARVGALDQFVSSEDGTNLLAGYKRANNILAAEAKKNPDEQIAGHPDLGLATHVAETALIQALDAAVPSLDTALASEDFAAAMRVLAGLRGPVDAFFEGVLVNDPDPAIRLNRLRLLTFVRDTANRVANFATISG